MWSDTNLGKIFNQLVKDKFGDGRVEKDVSRPNTLVEMAYRSKQPELKKLDGMPHDPEDYDCHDKTYKH